jgi:NDP-sugar pyrophosphorylase family protein
MPNNETKVVILAGGKGTRFHPFSFVIPKPLMPIGQDPILLHLINQFKQDHFKNFIISTGYQAELVMAYFGNGEKFDVNIEYFNEDHPLGTAGPLSLIASKFKDDEYFFLINGDVYTELQFKKMQDFAETNNLDIVVGCVEKIEKSSFGVLEIESSNIKEIIEKPERRFSISSGIYVLNGRAASQIPFNEFFTMPDLINTYLKKGLSVGAYTISDFWMGIENVENLDEVLKRTEKIKHGE